MTTPMDDTVAMLRDPVARRDGDGSTDAGPRARGRLAGVSFALPLAGGWLGQLLLLVMLFVTGMAIHDLRPAGTSLDADATAWLPWLMALAGLTGGLLSATRLRSGWVDLLVALVGTIVGLAVVSAVVSDAASLGDRLRVLEASISTALADLLVERGPSPEVSPFLLTLSALAWTTGAYAAISVGRHARVSGAIVPVGAMLLVPVILAEARGEGGGQLLWLAIGVVAALFLVLLLNLERQRVRWLRRQVTGGRAVGRSFLGGGAVLVSAVTAVAVALTAMGGGAPLAAGWERVATVLEDWGMDVGQLREPPDGLSGGFPDAMPLRDSWTPRDVTFFTARTDAPHYWRGATYDRFDGRTWRQTDGQGTDFAAFDDLSGATADIASEDLDGFADVSATITLNDLRGDDLVAPQNPVEVDVETRVRTMGEEGPFQVLEPRQRLDRDTPYQVQALEPALDPTAADLGAGDPLTQAMLRRAAETPDPEWIERFLQLPDPVGPRTVAVAERIKGDQTDRYRLARAVQRYLTGPRFDYETRPAACESGETLTDCLIRAKEGFCERYATTMVILLRQMGVPARYVVGYLPGISEVPGEFVVTGSAAHAWVEVWFNGFGWVRFDPTPGTSPAASDLSANGQAQTDLPRGSDPLDPSAGPDETAPPEETADPDETSDPEATEEPTPEPSEAPSLVTPPAGGAGMGLPPIEVALVVGGALAASLALLGLLWFRRLPGGGPDRAWRGITGVAGRFGRGPTPSQTPYEYGITLARVVPRVAQDIRTVADAKVAATYGPPGAASSSVRALRAAYARARTGLLALLLRRR